MPDGIRSDFVYVDLSAYSGKPFDGLASGTFTDMWGQEVKIDEADLAIITQNTNAAIQFTKTEGGEVVGLPIDASNHNRGDAAGWIVECSHDPEAKRIRLTPNWTEEGLSRIGKGLQRFFSATIDLMNKVILGGTLTNWPATRDKKNNILLRPIELSAPMFTYFEEEGVNNMSDQLNVEELRSSIVADLTPILRAELLQAVKDMTAAPVSEPKEEGQEDLISMFELEGVRDEVTGAYKENLLAQVQAIKDQAKVEAAKMLTALRHESNVADFCEKVVSGTSENPYGLPVEGKELSAFMLSLDPQKAKNLMGILEKIWKNGRVQFAELGHGNEIKTIALPLEVQDALSKGALVISDLNDPVLALGDLSQYDLSKWAK